MTDPRRIQDPPAPDQSNEPIKDPPLDDEETDTPHHPELPTERGPDEEIPPR